jgi:tight adherence protein B
MERSSLYLAMAVIVAALGAAALCSVIMDCLRERMRQEGLQRKAGVGSSLRRLLQRGIPLLAGPCRPLSTLRAWRDSMRRIESVLQIRGFACDEVSLGSLALAAMLALTVGGGLLGSWMAGMAFAVCFFVVVSTWASRAFERRRDCIREALPDAVRAMSACFHAGYTLQQTFEQLQRELPSPVGSLFGSARDAMETGSTAKQALAGLRGTTTVPELSFISVALEVQHRAGGSMRHVLDAACESLESELELRRSLRAHTAQARLSARVVTGVTIGLVGVLSLLSEDFLGPFFASPMGVGMLCLAIAMQCAGVLVIRKMLRIEVE